jgi:hypothetical protein
MDLRNQHVAHRHQSSVNEYEFVFAALKPLPERAISDVTNSGTKLAGPPGQNFAQFAEHLAWLAAWLQEAEERSRNTIRARLNDLPLADLYDRAERGAGIQLDGLEPREPGKIQSNEESIG